MADGDPGADRISVGIGANVLGYIGEVESCVAASSAGHQRRIFDLIGAHGVLVGESGADTV